MANDILSQLGVNLPPLPENTGGATGTAPVAEAMTPPNKAIIEAIADMTCLSCLKALEQIALPAYGATSDKGKKLIRIINMLETVVPENMVKEASTKDVGSIINEMLGGMQTTPSPIPPVATPAPAGAEIK